MGQETTINIASDDGGGEKKGREGRKRRKEDWDHHQRVLELIRRF